METPKTASFGKVLPKDVSGHGEGFEKAFERALKKLDGDRFGGEKLEVRAFVSISPNPGGVSQYMVTLNPTG
ncbi:MAG: RNA-binding protein [Actinobacteria bacterium]|nr:MAG: RNA-binding protein [Actinomycetota bacterium]